MPHYVFVCADCHKEFTLVMHMDERSSREIRCPECGSARVEPKVAAFSAVTARKS
jgi:putative FmdB family regulatory protein